jgi:hypothetical protein
MMYQHSGLKFHHLGLAVREPATALRFLQSLGYEAGPQVHDELQGVNLVMCQSDEMPDVEVIFAAGSDGPLESILKRNDAQFYHLCFESSDLDATLTEWRREGYKPYCVAPRKPAVLFGGRHVSFYYLQGFGLVEILESASAADQ